jgi:hypothetical protein
LDAETCLQTVIRGRAGLPRVSKVGVSLILAMAALNVITFRCPGCLSHFSAVSSLIQHIESGKCGLAHRKQVNQIYTGMHDMFRKLIQN